jgi:hypothetical protein
MIDHDAYKEKVSEESGNEKMLFCDGYEDALIGYLDRFGTEPVALYDREKCINILMDRDKMTFEEAEEYFQFNTVGAWVGENTPGFVVFVEHGTCPTHGSNGNES